MARKEGEEMFRSPILYREWGWRFTKIERYDIAIDAFEKSMREADFEDLRTLLGLCQALDSFSRYHEAADVSAKCMEIDPQNWVVQWMRVKTLFKVAEFGYSLIHAHRGYKHRRLPFEWAIYQANETIEDCAGRNTSPRALVELYPWIKELESHRESLIAKLNEEEDEFEGINDEPSKFKVNDSAYKLETRLKSLDRAMAARYLGHLAVEKYFVEDLAENPSLRSANRDGSAKLVDTTNKCIIRSRYRQEVLRMRKPLYYYEFQRRSRPEGHKAMRRVEARRRKNCVIVEASNLLARLHETKTRRDYALFFRLVDRAKTRFDSHAEAIFPMKKSCLRVVYEMTAWAYIDPRDVTGFADSATKLRYLKHHLGIRIGALPRDEDLAWTPTSNGKAAMRIFRKRLALAADPLELAWLYHELSKFLTETRRYDVARFYAKKARDASNEAENEQWTLNANHLLVRIEICQNNRNEARDAALLAYLGAKRLGIESLQDFYRRVASLVDEIDLIEATSVDGVAAREQLIADLMPESMKNEVNFLLRSMRALPASRRLSVVPGCKPVEHKFRLPCKRNTILPNPPRDPVKEARRQLLGEYAPSKKILGFVDFDDYD